MVHLSQQLTVFHAFAEDDEEGREPVQAVVHLPQQLELPDDVKRSVKEQWNTLQSMLQDLRPIERFRVVGIAFRR